MSCFRRRKKPKEGQSEYPLDGTKGTQLLPFSLPKSTALFGLPTDILSGIPNNASVRRQSLKHLKTKGKQWLQTSQSVLPLTYFRGCPLIVSHMLTCTVRSIITPQCVKGLKDNLEQFWLVSEDIQFTLTHMPPWFIPCKPPLKWEQRETHMAVLLNCMAQGPQLSQQTI